MSLYRLHGLRQIFDQRTVLDLTELELAAGDSYALLGPNGCGKTTLLHILAFLVPPARGEIRFKGRLVEWREPSLRALRQQVVLVDQHPIMFTSSVMKNVEYGPALRGMPTRERRRLADQCLERVGMREFADRPAHLLSGGETQRVAIARALACEPEVLLFDEPTASVDVENQAVIEKILAELRGEKHISIIFATHRQLEAAKLADERIFLFAGKLTGPGGENLLTAHLEQRNGRSICRLGKQIVLEMPGNGTGRVRVLINPEGIMVKPLGPNEHNPQGETTYPARVVQMTAEGERIKLLLDLGISLQALSTREAVAASGIMAGDRVQVAFQPGAIQLAPRSD
jgi:tungstate transport system ATP-binding protein